MNNKNVIIIIGPTAVGKTELSLLLAKELNGEIVSADSRQIYKYMDIGTAKPTAEQRCRIVHYFIDIKYPHEYYSAGKFGKEARVTVNNILNQDKLPLIVGGSGLYIKALVDGFFDSEFSDQGVKEKLQTRAQQYGLSNLYQRLEKVDPVLSARLHPHDTQRIIRALEVWEVSGIPLSQLQLKKEESADFKSIFIGLNMVRQNLYQRINERVDEMIRHGLIDEVSKLKEMGYTNDLVSLQTVGYTEVFEYFKGSLTYDKMIELIKQKSRNYAKRQLTWFRKDKRIAWFDVNEARSVMKIIQKVENRIK